MLHLWEVLAPPARPGATIFFSDVSQALVLQPLIGSDRPQAEHSLSGKLCGAQDRGQQGVPWCALIISEEAVPVSSY